jgi:hypothetical protein
MRNIYSNEYIFRIKKSLSDVMHMHRGELSNSDTVKRITEEMKSVLISFIDIDRVDSHYFTDTSTLELTITHSNGEIIKVTINFEKYIANIDILIDTDYQLVKVPDFDETEMTLNS